VYYVSRLHAGCGAQLRLLVVYSSRRGVISVGFDDGSAGAFQVTSASGDRLIECVIRRWASSGLGVV